MAPSLRFAALLLAFVIAGCAHYGGAPVYGVPYLVSRQDLRDATAAVRAVNPVEEIYAYRVNSRDHIQIYISPDLDGSYWAARRVAGKWEQDGGELIIKYGARY